MNHSLIGQHPCMMRLRDTLVRYARLSLPILLLGESGCGKEIAARDYLHAQSVRQDAPWLAINCASLSPELLESTLFGHKKGAFTGAHQDHDGYFTQAANGTLFLDEVGDLPCPTAKLTCSRPRSSRVRTAFPRFHQVRSPRQTDLFQSDTTPFR